MANPIPANGIEVWRVRLDRARHALEQAQRTLSADEQERAARYRHEGAHLQFVITRVVLRQLLSGYVGQPPEQIALRYAFRGKPSLAAGDSALRFNVSHSQDVSLIAIAKDTEIGVDVEQVRKLSDMEALAKRFFSPVEHEQLLGQRPHDRPATFFRLWTAKESFIKAQGDGLAFPLDQFDVRLDEQGAARLESIRGSQEAARQWSLRSVEVDEGYKAACAWGGGGEADIALRDWPGDYAAAVPESETNGSRSQ